MSSLKYTEATIEDLPEIVEIYNSTVASRMVTADTEPVEVADKVEWFYKHHSKRPLWVITNEKGSTVGWVSFQSFYGRPAYYATVEIGIYLATAQRAKGYGKLILEHCIRQAPALDIKTLLGFIFSHNEPSIRLFEHFGFEEWATLPNVAILDGIEKSLKILGKRVA
jgi:L-amino acid N-acyltransferase YncA